jgi:hypothetical protein
LISKAGELLSAWGDSISGNERIHAALIGDHLAVGSDDAQPGSQAARDEVERERGAR